MRLLGSRRVSALLLGVLLLNCSSPPANDAETSDGNFADGPGTQASATGSGAQGCPSVGLIMASPGEVPVGGEIDISVSVDPADAGDLSYTWTSTSGQFEDAITWKTLFSCTAPGPATITVEVSGGEVADGAQCDEQRSTTVQCDPLPDASATASGACTMPGQQGCLACIGSPYGLCSPTEEALVEYDPSGSCYSCLLEAGCLDNTEAGLAGNECDDLVGDATSGPDEGAWKPSLCMQTITCILQSACADPSVFDCYCGMGVGSSCADSGVASGPCASTENAGLETSDVAVALGPAFTSKSLAGGVANSIFLCAAANHCTTCLAKSSQGAVDAGVAAEE